MPQSISAADEFCRCRSEVVDPDARRRSDDCIPSMPLIPSHAHPISTNPVPSHRRPRPPPSHPIPSKVYTSPRFVPPAPFCQAVALRNEIDAELATLHLEPLRERLGLKPKMGNLSRFVHPKVKKEVVRLVPRVKSWAEHHLPHLKDFHTSFCFHAHGGDRQGSAKQSTRQGSAKEPAKGSTPTQSPEANPASLPSSGSPAGTKSTSASSNPLAA